MEKHLEDLIESLPPKPSRSRLAPYGELINEMRKRGWTYREIARVLVENCGVQVSPSNVHHYVNHGKGDVSNTANFPPVSVRVGRPDSQVAAPDPLNTSREEIQQRITTLKHRRLPATPGTKAFEFDAREPLRLSREKNAANED